MAATCLHFLPCSSVSLFCGLFISNFFVLISPLLFTFFNRSNLPFFVLFSTFFSLQYSLFLSLFFVFIRLCTSISSQFLSCLSFHVFVFSIYLYMFTYLDLLSAHLSLPSFMYFFFIFSFISLSLVFSFCFFCLIHFPLWPLSLLIFTYLYTLTSFYNSFSVLSPSGIPVIAN
jgi:hypothetical protein